MTFEQKLEKLEKINAEIQNPETELEKAVSLYEDGMKIAADMEKDLSRLERRIEIVTSAPGSEEGLITEPYKAELSD